MERLLRRADLAAVIVADASDEPDCVAAVSRLPTRLGDPRLAVLERLEPGRGRQMNAGAAIAGAPWLLFLHVDTVLPALDLPPLLTAGGRRWGRFDVRIDARGLPYRLIGASMNLRSRLTGVATGDQAIFVRRADFNAIGGFRAIELMEDIDLCDRLLGHCGRPACVRAQVVTSARRWRECGVMRTVWLMWMLRLRYRLGADPARLARRYRQVRGR